ncbi:MAG: hypothetical protein ACRDTF_17255 [Pseudonocardiaceae bacterium]
MSDRAELGAMLTLGLTPVAFGQPYDPLLPWPATTRPSPMAPTYRIGTPQGAQRCPPGCSTGPPDVFDDLTRRQLIVGATALGVLGACGSQAVDSNTDGGVVSGFPVTIEHRGAQASGGRGADQPGAAAGRGRRRRSGHQAALLTGTIIADPNPEAVGTCSRVPDASGLPGVRVRDAS